jgi:hypothetical protein
MENIEIKVTIKEETKKTKVYDFSESIKALEKVQEMSSAIVTEVNEKICNYGMQASEEWVAKLHRELKPVLSNYAVMKAFQRRNQNGINFGYANFRTEGNWFVLSIYNSHNTPRIKVYFYPNTYTLDFSMYFNPETDLHRVSECADFIHETIMREIEYTIRQVKVEAQKQAEVQVKTLENLLNM